LDNDDDGGPMAAANVYDCKFTSANIRIDGLVDKPAWQEAPTLDFYIPVSQGTPQSVSCGRMLWDETYLYAAIKAYDKDIWGYHTQRDSQTCSEDVLEIFLKPDKKDSAYYNFEINPLGTVYDAFNVKRGAGGEDHHRWSMWNCEELLVGIDIKGTLNRWDDVDEYWCLEVAIPFAGLPTLQGRHPEPGETWDFHLARYDYSVYLAEGVELSSTARFSTAQGSFFHRYEEWQTMRFSR
jgi:hypothetical protein